MSKWQKSEMKLKPNHGWRCSAGHKLCVIQRGLMQFEYPMHWIVKPGESSIKLHEKTPPLDDMVLEISVLPMPPIRWEDVNLTFMLQESLLKNVQEFVDEQEIHKINRPDLELVWAEYSRMETDPKDDSQRMATWRQALAHCEDTVTVITYGYWVEAEAKAMPVWEHFLSTIIMNRMVEDPTLGPRFN